MHSIFTKTRVPFGSHFFKRFTTQMEIQQIVITQIHQIQQSF